MERNLKFSYWDQVQGKPLWKTVWWFCTKLNTLLSYDSAIVFLRIYPKELKTYVHTKTGTWMFITVLFLITKTWQQWRFSSSGVWIKTQWCNQTTEYVCEKGMSCEAMKWYYKVKAANLQRLPTAGFQLQDILGKAELGTQSKDEGLEAGGVNT